MKENSVLNKSVGIWIRVSSGDQAKGESPPITLNGPKYMPRPADALVPSPASMIGE
jgi:hypothetical protein